jgi:filamentous hemagglutinin family protein
VPIIPSLRSSQHPKVDNNFHINVKINDYKKYLHIVVFLLDFVLFLLHNLKHMQNTRRLWRLFFHSRRLGFFFVPILQLLFIPTTFANPLPTGHEAIHGNVFISQNGNFLNITTDSDRTISQWESFNISEGFTVNFLQPTEQSIHLNRVLGANPSRIYGTLQSNGSVYLINPNGILVGPSGTIETHGGLLSTLDIANHYFLNASNPKFIGSLPSRIDILGKIHSTGDSFTILSQSIHVAPQARIQAPNGRVEIAASDKVDLLIRPDNTHGAYIRVNTDLQAPPAGTIDIAGEITAQHIAVLSSGNPYAYAIRLHPEASLTALGSKTEAGRITLYARTGSIIQEGTLKAPSGAARLLAPEGKITQSGTIDVSSSEEIRRATSVRGGLIDILADEVELAALAKLLARGESGGGSIRVGGSWQGHDRSLPHARSTFVDTDAVIDASSTAYGNGGTVVVWSDAITRYYGTILAQGADAGDGGRVEVSGRDYLDFSGHVSTQAASGHKGLLLLDPENIEIINGPMVFPSGFNLEDPIWGANEDLTVSTLSVSVLEAILKENTVTLDAKNDITVKAPISWNSSSGLWITAGRHITIQAPITQIASDGFSLGINLHADTNNDGNGTLWILSPITQSHSDLNLVGASIRIDAPVKVNDTGGQISAVAFHGAIESALNSPALIADFIDLKAHKGIYGKTSALPLSIQSGFSLIAQNQSTGDIRLHNTTGGSANDYIFVNHLAAPQGSIYLAQSGGSSLYIGNEDTSFAAKAGKDISLILSGNSSAEGHPNLIFNRSVNAGGTLLAVSDGNITINSTATIGTNSITGGRVILAVGEGSPAAFAQATLTNNGTIESGNDLDIHASDEKQVKLGNTVVAGKTRILGYRYGDVPPSPDSNSADSQNTSSSSISSKKGSSESHYQSSSSYSFSSSGGSSQNHYQSSSSFSSSSDRMESFRSDFSRSSQSSSSAFSSAISQASASSSSYFSSRHSHSQSHSGPLSQEARSSSSQSMSQASSSSQSNFSFIMQSASSSSSSHFISRFPSFSLPPASAQFSTPPPSMPRFAGDPSPLARDFHEVGRYTLSQDSNKLWLSPFYAPDKILLSAEFLYPDSAIVIGDGSSSLSFNTLPSSLVSALSPTTRLLLREIIVDEDPLPEPVPPRRRREERRAGERPISKPKPAPQEEKKREEKKKPEAAPLPPSPAYGSGVVLTDDGQSLPLNPHALPEALKKAVSKSVLANLEEAIIADDY